jgi:tRNA-dihydrouridine synthase C
MTLLLAPMEGLLDFTLRDTLTEIGGIDRCVSEFIRVTGTLLPDKAFLRIVPELRNSGRTRAGTPVRAQLMGSDPACLADNAAKLAALGPAGIDLNFGCPAKVVNRHGGGAALLQEPELIHRIVREVRRAVPAAMPVSAKMRLGFDDDRSAEDCARAIAEGGAGELVVHARTKAHGYRPPAYWERIADVKSVVGIPVVANGEIWSVADAQRCREISGCDALMLGRGMVADPGLALAIRGCGGRMAWPALLPHMGRFWALVCDRVEARHRAGRMKQWLNYLRRTYPEAQQAYDAVRTITDSRALGEQLFGDAWLQAA